MGIKTELDVNRAWYGFEKTLQRIDLLDGRLSIDHVHLTFFKLQHAPDAHPWESNFEVTDEEVDQQQLDAMQEMEDEMKRINFAHSIARILHD